MSASSPALLPLSVLFGGQHVWTAARSARRLDLVRDAVLTLPGEPPLRMFLGPPPAGPSVAWAWVGDDAIGLDAWIAKPGWIAEGLVLGGSTRWLDAVVLDRLAPVFDWIEQTTLLRSEVPYVRFGVRAPFDAARAVSLRVERGNEVAIIGLALPDEAVRMALIGAFGEQAVADRTGDAVPRSGRDRIPSDFARESGTDLDGADDTRQVAGERTAIRAQLIEAHAPIDAQTLAATRNGDGLVLDPVAGGGICRLWIAYEQSWFEIASLLPQSTGLWSVREAGFDGVSKDACLVAVEPGPFAGACVHVAASIGHVNLGAALLAGLKAGDRVSIASRPDRLREIVTPERALGLAELHNAGRHRIARLWSCGP